MDLDAATSYTALQARDARFDGRFFVGVTSTGIYCRPICPARTPRPENCRFFPTAAAAEAADFRPCLRCRPELAPGHARIDAVARLAADAVGLVEDGALEAGGVPALARRLGVTDRHLRRVFHQEFGLSPIAYGQTHRLLLAKRLLTDTSLPVTTVALASGFSSLRRFNALFRERYRLSPTDLRKHRPAATADLPLTFTLAARPPFDAPALLAFLGRRAIPGIETVDGEHYRRTVVVLDRQGEAHRGWLEAVPGPQSLHVALSASLAPVVPAVLSRVHRLFDLKCHPLEIAAHLGPLAAARPGLRLPGAFDGFEAAVRAVLGQQVTVQAATTLAGRFGRAFGTPLQTPWLQLTHTFPLPAQVVPVDKDAIAALGVIGTRAATLQHLAAALADGTLRLEPGGDVAATLAHLQTLPGIGAWTAHYLAMRALGWPDAFPHTDFGVKKALGLRLPQDVLARAEAWRPWRAYAVMHLWQSLADAGNKESG